MAIGLRQRPRARCYSGPSAIRWGARSDHVAIFGLAQLADDVALDVLPVEEAVAFLQSRTGRSDAAGAKTMAEALGRLPPALDKAAAYGGRRQTRLPDA